MGNSRKLRRSAGLTSVPAGRRCMFEATGQTDCAGVAGPTGLCGRCADRVEREQQEARARAPRADEEPSPPAAPAHTGLERLRRALAAEQLAQRRVHEAIDALLTAGYSYADVGAELGVTRQAARQRHLRHRQQ